MTPQQLMKLGKSGKCVVWLSGRHMPVAFIAHMEFWRVMNALPRIKPYKPKRKKA